MQSPLRIQFTSDGSSRWAGMGDYVLVAPDQRHEVFLRYLGEPPHGDSFHEARIDGVKLPGLVWGCYFAFTENSRFFAASWMLRCYERRTIIVDIEQRRYYLLPEYLLDFSISWPVVLGLGFAGGLNYRFDGTEVWTLF